MTSVLVFRSIHQVMKAEKLMKSQGLRIDLIPVPREISSDCGVAIEILSERRKEALRYVHEAGIAGVACYQRSEKGEYEIEE